MNRSLKAAIVAAFGSQQEFAKALRVSPSLISRTVRGRRRLPADKIHEWAHVLGSTPEALGLVA